MVFRYPAVLILLYLTGCTMTNPSSPVVVTSHQPVMTSREKGYVACATALYGAYTSPHRLALRQAYQSGLVEDGEIRLFRLSGWLIDDGERRQVEFECLTEPSHRARVLSLTRVSTYPFGN